MLDEPSGLIRWIVDIRLSMIDDPGRKELQSDINTHGYQWLDEYWENILAGPKNETLVELVKTPARRKEIQKRNKLETGTIGRLKTIPDVAQSTDMDKENTPTRPKNVKKKLNSPVASPRRDPFKPIRNNNILKDTDVNSIKPISNPFIQASDYSKASKPTLSVQAMVKEKPIVSATEENISELDKVILSDRVDPKTPNFTSEHSHQVAFKPLNSGKHAHLVQSQPETIEASCTKEKIDHNEIDATTCAKSSPRSASPSNHRHTLTHKASIQTLPALPQLSPLRKSVQRGSSFAPVAQQAILHPSRSSWLVKAREGRTVTETTFTSSVALPAITPVYRTKFAPKRKSNALEGTDDEDYTREITAKLPKTTEAHDKSEPSRRIVDEIVRYERVARMHYTEMGTPPDLSQKSVKSIKESVSVWETQPSQEEVPLADADQPTTILESLRRKVEGFSSRFLKPGTKSLGGAAFIAATEARAAAQARLKQRQGTVEANGEKQESRPSGGEAELSLSVQKLNIPVDNATQEKGVTKHSVERIIPDRSTTPTQDPPYSVTEKEPSRLSTHVEAVNEHEPMEEDAPVFKPLSPRSRPAPAAGPKTHSPAPTTVFHPAAFASNTSSLTSLGPPQVTRVLEPNYSSTFSPLFSTQSSAAPSIFDRPVNEMGELISSQDTVFTQPNSQLVFSQPSRLSQPMGQPPPLLKAFMDQGRDNDSTSELTGPMHKQPVKEMNMHNKDDTLYTADLRSLTSTDKPTFGLETSDDDADDAEDIGETEDVDMFGHSDAETEVQGPLVDKVASNKLSCLTKISQESTMTMKKSFMASKNGKPGVKSIQLAAAAARKQQEEAEKKAVRLRDMENRRQQVLQRKQEEERSRAAQIEKKNKEDAEKRRKEREEFAEKRAKLIVKKTQGSDDDLRKAQPSRLGKPMSNTSQNGPQAGPSAVSKTVTAPKHANVPVPAAVPTVKLVSSSLNTKTSVTSIASGDLRNISSASTLKAVVMDAPAPQTSSQAAQGKRVETREIETEYMELPSINSEYSDEDDVEHQLAKKAAQPDWAQSPELARALALQERINPYHIFGDIQPLRMEEIFRNRQNRFRNRSSSANWITAGDAVTVEEEIDYARRMGFQS